MTAYSCARRLSCSALFAAMLVAAATSAQASVEISSKPTHNMNCSGGVCTPTAKNADLNATDLANMLAASDVKVVTGSGAVTITVSSSFSWTSAHRLTLDAYRSIAFNKPVVVAGTGALTISTNDGGSGGGFRFFGKGHVEFWDQTSSLVVNGNAYMLAKSIKQIRSLAHAQTPFIALARSIDAARQLYPSSPIPSFGKTGQTFEGLGNTISNLAITIPGDPNVQIGGLFGNVVGPSGDATVIRDIGLVSANVQGAGFDQCVGALVGQMFLTVTVENAYATGQLSAGQGSTIGGLVGCNISGTIRHSYSAVAVTDTAEARAVGGLVGANFNCDTICSDGVAESYATGAVVGGDAAWVGGLVADNEGGTVTNSYATGTVTGGSSARVGGLLGICSAGFTNSVVTDSYSTGAVSGGSDAFTGGSVGYDFGSCGYTDISWNLDTSGIGDPAHGAGNVQNDPGITGLTTEQFKSGLPAGFNPSIWKEKAAINNGYPYLLANPPPQ